VQFVYLWAAHHAPDITKLLLVLLETVEEWLPSGFEGSILHTKPPDYPYVVFRVVLLMESETLDLGILNFP
jgi:hypothetical protein